MTMKNVGRSWGGWLLGLALAVVTQVAMAATFDVLVDADNQAATGCSVTTPGGVFSGVEFIVSTRINTGVVPPVVSGVTRQDCVSGSTFGSPVSLSAGGWPVGSGRGTSGYDVLETFIPKAAFAGRARLAFSYDDSSFGSTALITANGQPSGNAILFDLNQGIPTLTEWGLAGLCLGMLWMVYRHFRHQRRVAAVLIGLTGAAVATSVWAAMVLDGQITDWVDIRPLSTGNGSGPLGADLTAVFVKPEGDNVYVRADIKTSNASPSATNLSTAESYTEDGTLKLTGIVVSDPDSSTVTATLTLPDTRYGSLSTGVSGSATATYNPATGVWSAYGSVADVNALLANVVFTPTVNFSGSFSIATRVTDGVSTPVTGSKVMTGVKSGHTVVTTASDTTADDGYCSLREAIVASNTGNPSGSTPGECPGGADANALTVTHSLVSFNTDDLTVSSSASVTCTGTTPVIRGVSTAGMKVTAGTLSVAGCGLEVGTFTVQSGAIAAFSRSGASLKVSGSLSNAGQITATSGLAIEAADVTNALASSVLVTGQLDLTTTGSVSNSGSVTASTHLNLTTTGTVTNDGTKTQALGTLVATTGNVSITAATFVNHGTVNAGGNTTVSATALSNTVAGGDNRSWVYRSSFRTTSHTDSWYSFPDNYEKEYHDDYWTDYQVYTGGAPTFTPSLKAVGTVTLQGFTTASNVGALIQGDIVTLIKKSGLPTPSFTNTPMELTALDYVHHYEYYTHYIALGPLKYDDHVLQNDSTGVVATRITSPALGGVVGNTINKGGFVF